MSRGDKGHARRRRRHYDRREGRRRDGALSRDRAEWDPDQRPYDPRADDEHPTAEET